MAVAQRYSDKRRRDDFVAYVLLSEPIRFSADAILAAARRDYPALVWSDALNAGLPFNSATAGLATYFADAAGKAAGQPGMMTLIGNPGGCRIDWAPVLAASRPLFPEAAEAVARHTNAISIHVPSVDDSLPARFDAARRMTCLAALFARLPVSTGVYLPSADLVMQPARCVAAAARAMRAELPVPDWLSIVPVPVQDGSGRSSVSSIGLAAFVGAEVIVPMVRDVARAAGMVAAASTMAVQYGHVFHDSDTIGTEDGMTKMRLRFLEEGRLGVQTDTWVILAPDSALDEVATFGPRARPPAPPGVGNGPRRDPRSLMRRLFRRGAGAMRA